MRVNTYIKINVVIVEDAIPLNEFLDDLLALLVAEPLFARVVHAVDPAEQMHQLVETHADIADTQISNK